MNSLYTIPCYSGVNDWCGDSSLALILPVKEPITRLEAVTGKWLYIYTDHYTFRARSVRRNRDKNKAMRLQWVKKP